MADVERATINRADVTVLTDKTIPKSWTCPHCGKRQKTGKYAEETLLEHFKYLEHCVHCGYVHAWELRLTDDFKRKVLEYLRNI